jgi:hypothetical protein
MSPPPGKSSPSKQDAFSGDADKIGSMSNFLRTSRYKIASCVTQEIKTLFIITRTFLLRYERGRRMCILLARIVK